MIDDKKAIDSLNKTDKKAEGVGGKLLGMGKSAVKGAAILGGATLAGGTALLGMAKKAADSTDRIDKMSQKIGMSRKGFQEWEYILGQNGASIESMQGGMKKLTNVIDQAAAGTGKGADIMKKLGISVKDSTGAVKDQETVFNEAVVALQGMENGTEKAKLANELFGGSGKELMPLLNGTTEGMEELRQAANDMGIVLSDDAVASGAAFTDTMDNVQKSLGAVGAKVGVAVMPIIQNLLDWVLAHMPEIQAVTGAVFGFIGDAVTTVTDVFETYLMPIFDKVFNWVKDKMPLIQSIIDGAFTVIKDVVTVAFGVIKSIYDTVLKPVIDAMSSALSALVEWVKERIPDVKNTFSNVFERIKEVWETTLKPVVDVMLGKFEEVVEWVKSNWPAVKETLSNVFQAIWDAYTTYLKVVFEKIIEVGKTVVTWFIEHWPEIQEIFGKVVATLKNLWDTVLKPTFEKIKEIASTVVKWFKENWPAIQEKISQVFKGIKTVWDAVLWPVFKKVIEVAFGVVNWFIDKWPMIQKVIKVAFDGIKLLWNTVLKPVFDLLMKIVGKIKDTFTEKFVPMVKDIKKWFDDIKDGIKEKIEFAQEKVQGAIDKITGFFDGIKKVKDDVLGWFSDIKDGIAEKIDGARKAVSDAIDKIKGFFDFKFTWPKLSMPKFGIEGSMNPLKWLKDGVPKLTVKWNAAGAIFDRPTIFNTPYGLQGVGEAGPEAVAPIGTLMGYVRTAVEEARGNQGMNIVVNVDRMDSTTDVDELMEYMGNRMKEKAYSLGLV